MNTRIATESIILDTLSRGGADIKELAADALVSESTVRKVVRELEAANVVQVSKLTKYGANDRRVLINWIELAAKESSV